MVGLTSRCSDICGRYFNCSNIEINTMNPPTIITRNYEDQCGCHKCCTFPNNVWAILPTQIITFAAFLMAADAVGNCRIIAVQNTKENNSGIDQFNIDNLFNGTIPQDIINNNSTQRSLGFFAWENIDGECTFGYYWGEKKSDTVNADDILHEYWTFVGGDWQFPIVMAVLSAIIVFVVMIWIVFTLSCVSNSRRYRTTLVVLLTIVIPSCLSLIFTILRSDFCVMYNCKLGEAGQSIVQSIPIFFSAGIILYFGTSNFPGNPYRQRKPFQCMFWRKAESDTTYTNHIQSSGSTTTGAIEMSNYNNGVADAIEIPVESEFIDRTLIDSNAPSFPTSTEVPQPETASGGVEPNVGTVETVTDTSMTSTTHTAAYDDSISKV